MLMWDKSQHHYLQEQTSYFLTKKGKKFPGLIRKHHSYLGIDEGCIHLMSPELFRMASEIFKQDQRPENGRISQKETVSILVYQRETKKYIERRWICNRGWVEVP